MNGESYIFVSYCHRSSFQQIRRFIDRLIADGYNIWFDSNLSGGSGFNDDIAMRIKNCSCFISMIDADYIASEYCKDELFYARSNQCGMIPIFLEETKLTPGVEMRLSQQIHQIHKNLFPNEEDFYEEVLRSKYLQVLKKK